MYDKYTQEELKGFFKNMKNNIMESRSIDKYVDKQAEWLLDEVKSTLVCFEGDVSDTSIDKEVL